MPAWPGRVKAKAQITRTIEKKRLHMANHNSFKKFLGKTAISNKK
jgi:hypothetical protein